MTQRILSAYKGEVYGIAFFTHFVNHYQHASPSLFWQHLVDVEIRTADLLEIELEKHHISHNRHDADMINKGIADAAKWIELPYNALIATLTSWVEPYESKYRLWSQEASDDEALVLIAAHETAIYHCLKAEQNGISGLPILKQFLKDYSA